MIKPTQSSRVRSSPYPLTKPSSILLGADRQSRKRKSLSWQPDDDIKKVHYFEYIADERINVARANAIAIEQQHRDTNASATQLASGSSLYNQNKLSNSIGGGGGGGSNVSIGLNDSVDRLNGKHDAPEKEYSSWLLIPIEFAPELPSPGWNSLERTAQAEREQYVLGAIDLPGLPSILDEPDNHNATLSSDSNTTKEGDHAKLIPLDSDEGVITSYTNDNMYSSEIVNGVRISTENNTDQQQHQHHQQQHQQQQQQQLLQQNQQQQLQLQQQQQQLLHQQQHQQQMTIPNGVWTTPYPWLGIQAATRAGPVEGEIHNLFSHARYF